jgi:hypothetical protein
LKIKRNEWEFGGSIIQKYQMKSREKNLSSSQIHLQVRYVSHRLAKVVSFGPLNHLTAFAVKHM